MSKKPRDKFALFAFRVWAAWITFAVFSFVGSEPQRIEPFTWGDAWCILMYFYVTIWLAHAVGKDS